MVVAFPTGEDGFVSPRAAMMAVDASSFFCRCDGDKVAAADMLLEFFFLAFVSWVSSFFYFVLFCVSWVVGGWGRAGAVSEPETPRKCWP